MTWIIFVIGVVVLLFDHEDDGSDTRAIAILIVRGFGVALMITGAIIHAFGGA